MLEMKEEWIDEETQEQIEKRTLDLMQNMTDNTKYIIAKINVLYYGYINAEHEYQLRKNDYEIKFNQLVLGEAYAKKFKTIKSREQQAVIDLKERKTELQKIKTTRSIYKAELELLRNQLQLLMLYERGKEQ